MVVGVAHVRKQRRRAELGIRLDEILRESVGAQNRAVHVGGNVRQVGVNPAGLAVVQRRERGGQGGIVSVRQVVPDRAGCCSAQLLGSTQSRAGNVDAFEHFIQ